MRDRSLHYKSSTAPSALRSTSNKRTGEQQPTSDLESGVAYTAKRQRNLRVGCKKDPLRPT